MDLNDFVERIVRAGKTPLFDIIGRGIAVLGLRAAENITNGTEGVSDWPTGALCIGQIPPQENLAQYIEKILLRTERRKQQRFSFSTE